MTPVHEFPSPAKAGEGGKRKDPTAALRARRHRERKKAGGKAAASPAPAFAAQRAGSGGTANEIKADVTVSRSPGQAVDVTAYAAAMAPAGVAAWFSIRGMVVLFPGSPLSVIGMACAMETANLVTAGWLARRWRATAWIWRLVLVALVGGLAVINAAGVYAQLVAAHVGDRGAAQSGVETQEATLAIRIDVQAKTVADVDTRVAQIDAAIAEATKRGKTTAALSAIEGQRKARAALVEERKREVGTLAALQTERASVAANGRQIAMDAALIAYVAAVFGVADQKAAIRWLIALMVLCCDPLAIALTAAASWRPPSLQEPRHKTGRHGQLPAAQISKK